jgi:hypothetical protein
MIVARFRNEGLPATRKPLVSETRVDQGDGAAYRHAGPSGKVNRATESGFIRAL